MNTTLLDSDEILERKIRAELASMQACEALANRERAMEHWLESCRLIKLRSLKRVRQMERDRGLA